MSVFLELWNKIYLERFSFGIVHLLVMVGMMAIVHSFGSSRAIVHSSSRSTFLVQVMSPGQSNSAGCGSRRFFATLRARTIVAVARLCYCKDRRAHAGADAEHDERVLLHIDGE